MNGKTRFTLFLPTNENNDEFNEHNIYEIKLTTIGVNFSH